MHGRESERVEEVVARVWGVRGGWLDRLFHPAWVIGIMDVGECVV